MKILVIGGTGTVGSQVVADLLARNADVRVLTRSEQKAHEVPEGAQAAVGDLAKPETLPAAFQDIDALFLLVPIGPQEAELGLQGVRAAQDSEVQKIVYMSVGMPPGSEHIPHFASKIPIEQAIMNSGLEWTILRPTNFYQNDLWVKDVITEQGVYPYPIGKRGINRVDVRDIADAAVTSLLESGHHGRIYELQGPENLSGPRVAEVYSQYLGRDVRYIGDDLDAWAEQAKSMLPDWMIGDYKIMFTFFQEHGFSVPDNPDAPLRDALKHEPRRFEDFAVELVEESAAVEN